MDYDDRWRSDGWHSRRDDSAQKEMKAHADKLARIACKAMTELVKSGYADFLLLQDDEVREWWEKHQEDDRKAREAKAEMARIAKLKKDALAKLSDEEKAVLGIKTPKKKDSNQELVEQIQDILTYNLRKQIK